MRLLRPATRSGADHATPRARYVRWRDGEMWLGHFEEYPDYMTQGASIEELEENLRDLYRDLAGGSVPPVRSVAELQL